MKRKFEILLTLFVCVFASAGAGWAQTETAQFPKTSVDAPVAAPTKSGYRLGVGDEVEVRVLGEDVFNGRYTVDEDGQFQLPFVETPIVASCKTDRELRTELTGLLKKYLREPQVSVRIAERRSRPPAMLYGEVRNPQQFDLRRDVRLLELLSYSGGVTDSSNGTIQIFHTHPVFCAETGEKMEYQPANAKSEIDVPFETYKLSEVRDGKKDANPFIRPGDVIVVQKAAPVYMVGEIKSPQGIYIPERGLTLTDAVAMTGGLNERAKKKDVRIFRLKPGSPEREMISVNLELIKKGQQPNPVLQPYDIVEVEKAPKGIATIVKEIVTGGIGTASNTLFSGVPARILY